MKRFLKILILIFVPLFIAAILFVLIFIRGMDQIKKAEVGDLDLSKIQDGEYFGKFESGRWQYDVRVVISGGEIRSVEILNDKCGFIEMIRYKEINNEVINRILKRQSLKIDTVTGATINTKALLKAVEKALTH